MEQCFGALIQADELNGQMFLFPVMPVLVIVREPKPHFGMRGRRSPFGLNHLEIDFGCGNPEEFARKRWPLAVVWLEVVGKKLANAHGAPYSTSTPAAPTLTGPPSSASSMAIAW